MASVVSQTIWEEYRFSGERGLPIYFQAWKPPVLTRGVLAISHGLGEHGGRYGYLAESLVERGYAVYALDHRGHGRSQGQRGYTSAWSDLREDLRTFLKRVWEMEPGQSTFLMGHSLGGLIALEYALHYPDQLRGVIASAPAMVSTAIPPSKLLLARILSRVYPGYTANTGLDSNGISSLPEEVQRYLDDPLVHDLGTARLSIEVAKAQKYTMEAAPNFTLPLLIIHGGADHLIPPEASRAFYERVANPDKQYILYPDIYHETHNDRLRQQVFSDLDRWIQRHL